MSNKEVFADSDSNADMPTIPPGEESLVFAKPHYEDQPFEELLEYVARQGADPDFPPDTEVRYAQTRKLAYFSHKALLIILKRMTTCVKSTSLSSRMYKKTFPLQE
jgi:hypothetical protein